MEEVKQIKAYIYKISHSKCDKIYIGSTTQKNINKRFYEHKYKFNNNCLTCKSREIFKYGSNDCKIELIEEVLCNNKKELYKIEGEHIKNNNCINKIIAGRNKKEYIKDNKEIINDKERAYRLLNKKKTTEKNLRWKIKNEENRLYIKNLMKLDELFNI